VISKEEAQRWRAFVSPGSQHALEFLGRFVFGRRTAEEIFEGADRFYALPNGEVFKAGFGFGLERGGEILQRASHGSSSLPTPPNPRAPAATLLAAAPKAVNPRRRSQRKCGVFRIAGAAAGGSDVPVRRAEPEFR